MWLTDIHKAYAAIGKDMEFQGLMRQGNFYIFVH